MDYDNAAFAALNAAEAFNGFGVDLPEDAEQYVSRLTELRQTRPEPPASNAVALLLADSAKPAIIDEAIAFHVGHAHRTQQHYQAENIVGQRALAAILADRDRIHAELKATADEIIERLHRAAELSETVTDLIRQRRTDEAHLLATADSDAAELVSLYQARDFYLTPRLARWETGWWTCRYFRNPWDVQHAKPVEDTQWGAWQGAIRAGGELWYPSVEEATEASSAHEPAEMVPPIDPQRAVFTG